MPIFKYKGKNRVGTIVTGERSARSPQEVIAALEKEQIQVLNVERKAMAINIPFITGKRKKKVTLRDLSVFNRQLAVETTVKRIAKISSIIAMRLIR